MEKCILAIALCEAMPTLGSQSDKELNLVKKKDGCEVVALGPVVVFPVTQDHNTRFGLEEHKLLILLNGYDAHSGKGLQGIFFTERSIFT